MKTETDNKSRISVRDRIIDELKELAIITAYLYVCFTAVIQLKAAILHAQGVPYATLGLAAVKAVICAKFMLLALQLPFLKASESMGNHDSEIVDACSVD